MGNNKIKQLNHRIGPCFHKLLSIISSIDCVRYAAKRANNYRFSCVDF